MSFAEFFTEHDILINTSLYLFIEIGIIEAQSQSVRPFFSNHTDFSNHSFIMVLVIETFQMVNLTFVEWRKTHFIDPFVGILQKELIREEFGFTADCQL